MHLKIDGSCLKTTKKYYLYAELTELNIYIVHELSSNLNNFDLTLENCLFGAVRLTKNAAFDKYKYLGYGIGFDSRGTFLFPYGSFAQNVIIFRVDMSSSLHIDNKKNYILTLGEGPTKGLDCTTLTSEKTIQLI